jgi:LPS sulfotransferase NodH
MNDKTEADDKIRFDQIATGKKELLHMEALISERWDRSDGVATRFRYVVLSLQRTGSELLCASLQQRGLGIPFEYFNPKIAADIAGRLGALDAKDRVSVPRYVAALHAKRSRHGVFGAKLQPDQLQRVVGGNKEAAKTMLRRFDKVILLRRRDRLLQAVSLARSLYTNQWHLYGDDKARGRPHGDDLLFPMIAKSCTRSSRTSYAAEMLSGLDPQDVRNLWYEDRWTPALKRPRHGCEAVGGRPAGAKLDRDLGFPELASRGAGPQAASLPIGAVVA